MDTKKVLFFLDLLNSQTRGFDGEIADIYNRALDENDDIICLKSLLDEYIYDHEKGNSLRNTGNKTLNDIYNNPARSLDILPQVKHINDSIQQEVIRCNELMKSPLPFYDDIIVMKKQNKVAYMGALKSIASVCVYLIMLYDGLGQIKNLTWNDTVGIQERINAVNTKFLPSLLRTDKADKAWIIRKGYRSGKNFLAGNYYYLTYDSIKNMEMICTEIDKEPMGTHAFFNIDAYETNQCGVPYCWGIGNIVSVKPDNAILYLQTNIISELRAPKDEEIKIKMPTPFNCLKSLSDGHAFCITPDKLVLALNQWHMGHEIEKRKKGNRCLLCGEHINGSGLICSLHSTNK